MPYSFFSAKSLGTRGASSTPVSLVEAVAFSGMTVGGSARRSLARRSGSAAALAVRSWKKGEESAVEQNGHEGL
jgi:uncharacterized membrane protein (DUF4010 family)